MMNTESFFPVLDVGTTTILIESRVLLAWVIVMRREYEKLPCVNVFVVVLKFARLSNGTQPSLLASIWRTALRFATRSFARPMVATVTLIFASDSMTIASSVIATITSMRENPARLLVI